MYAFFCAFALLLCELASKPYADMGISDDWSYILSAQKLAGTGHIVYNGWATALLGSQLYLGAAFIKLWGFSFTTVRFSTLALAMVTAFLLQRILVRIGLREQSAALGTLALVLSPLFMMLSVTFMSDIPGLFAVVICLYGCIRALQTPFTRSIIAWLCFAVLTNAVFGSSRQIAWLGVLVMVPSTLWILRARRNVLFAGAAATLTGAFFIFSVMHWFARQPYSVPELSLTVHFTEHVLPHVVRQFAWLFLDLPFLLLPVMVPFLLQTRGSNRRALQLGGVACFAYLLLVLHSIHSSPNPWLEPTGLDWVSLHGMYEDVFLQGTIPPFLHTGIRILLTILSIGSLMAFFTALARLPATQAPAMQPSAASSPFLSWKQLFLLLGPFTAAYVLLLAPRSTGFIFDRYMLSLLVVALVCVLRVYQDIFRRDLSFECAFFILLFAIYSISITHNMFSFYRARVTLAAELRADGISDTAVDNGWEYNAGVELQHSAYVNEPKILLPTHSFVPAPARDTGSCPMFLGVLTRHIVPIYAVSFSANACAGPADFPPVHYSRWLASQPGTLYVVKEPVSPR